MPNETTVKRIKIEVGVSGDTQLKQFAAQFGNLNRSLKSTSDTLGFFKTAFNTLFFGQIAGVGIKTITDFSDSMQNLGNRIEILSGSSAQAADTMRGLLDASNRTKTSVDGLATIYARLAASTEEAGLSSGTLLRLTETLQNTFRLSGATTSEATNAAVQLSQGFASGQLRGQELRSVLEQNVVIGGILSKSLGKTRGELYKFAEAGKLTSGVVLKALFDNIGQVDEKAKKLGQTFEQTVTVATNDFKFAIGELNKEFDLSGKFAAGVEDITKKLKVLGIVTREVVGYYQESRNFIKDLIPAGALDAVDSLSGRLSGLKKINQDFEDVGNAGSIRGAFVKRVEDRIAAVDRFAGSIVKSTVFLRDLLGVESKFGDQALIKFTEREDERRFESLIDKAAQSDKILYEQLRQADEYSKAQKEIAKVSGKGNVELDKRQVLLRKLNLEYEYGAVSVSSYYEQLEEVDKLGAKRDFLTGKKDLEQFNEQLRKIKENDLKRSLNEGTISMQMFNEAVEQNSVDKLNEQLQAGKITTLEFDEALVKVSSKFLPGSALRAGTEDYLRSIGTLSQQISGLVSGTFSKLEDSLVAFTKNGKFNFNDFAQSVLDDLNRIIIRSLIIRPLAEGLIGGFAGESYGATASTNAQRTGAAPFAKGGVFDGPVNFGYGRGKLGVMGEAGPEAIVPLKRGSDGALGVQASTSPVYVNIVNQSGGEVQQKESTGPGGQKQIDILILGKVKEGIANGSLDRTMSQAYGLTRRGG